MSETMLIDVTDIKQYVCCPRLVYYRYCLPDVRPLTYAMEVGIQAHQQEEEREVRRSLKTYGIEQGERLFHYPVASEALEMKGKIDLVLIVPSWQASEKEVVVVEYKYTEQKAGPHFKMQLAAYALLLEYVSNPEWINERKSRWQRYVLCLDSGKMFVHDFSECSTSYSIGQRPQGRVPGRLFSQQIVKMRTPPLLGIDKPERHFAL